MNELMNINV